MASAVLASLFAMSSCGGGAFDPDAVPDNDGQVLRVEPLSWWTGMKTELQLMIYGPKISDYAVSFEGGTDADGGSISGGVSVREVHTADSPDYLFVDVAVASSAKPGTYWLVFEKDSTCFKYPYEIAAREAGSAERKSFTTADLIYLIMPDRFADGDPSIDSTPDTEEDADRSEPFGRHGGDIQGIIDHLDYISELGATTIWSTPLLLDDAPQESYHGYACSDYYKIDPRYGTNELYNDYVAAAHAKGLKVIMDIVTNHCGTEHWWMYNLPFEDWIHQFPEYTHTNVAFSTNMDPNASKYDLNIQESGWFVPSMPDMNLDNPYVLKYFQQWAVWWLEYAGVDGLRVDTYPYNEKGPMSRWCAAVRNEYPNLNIVGECWTSSVPQLAYWQSGNPNKDGFDSNLPSIMDFPLFEAICGGVGSDSREWGQGMTRVYDCLSHDFAYNDLSHMMIFPGNHDTGRLGDVMRGNPDRVKIVMAMMATMRGIPQIFSGDEMMFRQTGSGDGGLRVDFPGGWEGDKVNLFTAEGREEASGFVGQDGRNGFAGPADFPAPKKGPQAGPGAPDRGPAARKPAGPAVKGLYADLFDYASTLFNWRQTKEVIHSGRTMHFLTRDNTYAYFRYNDTDAVFVYINNSRGRKAIPWSTYAEITEGLHDGSDVLTGEAVSICDTTTVAPRTALVVEYKR
ncbi:MAG: glycoside hydrolase family 13 protein [Bacteroidales bacterium]|nr:glycoside hydrolase family 13 protein [Bacteroidales bacterium]